MAAYRVRPQGPHNFLLFQLNNCSLTSVTMTDERRVVIKCRSIIALFTDGADI